MAPRAVSKAVPGRLDRRRRPRRRPPRAVRPGGARRDGRRSRSATRTGRSSCPTLDRMFDQLGGLGRLVKGRTVAIKLNLTGPPTIRLGRRPAGLAHWVHPRGDRRRRAPHGPGGRPAGPAARERLRERHPPRRVHVPGRAGTSAEIVRRGPAGGAREHELARPREASTTASTCRAEACSSPPTTSTTPTATATTFVSLTKLKDHTTAGVTLSMKNCFGNIPTTIYGDHVAEGPPDELPHSGRNVVFHDGARQPSSLAAPEIDPASPRHEGYRIPRVVVDICAARPIDLAIIDGIDSMGGTEGPWSGGEGCHPGRAGRRHELRQHRRRGHRGDGLRPDGARGREPRSTGATTSSSSRSGSASAAATWGGSRSRARRSARRASTSRRSSAAAFPARLPPYPAKKTMSPSLPPEELHPRRGGVRARACAR